MDAKLANAVDTLGTTIADSGMRAAARIILSKGLRVTDVNLEALTVELRKELLVANDAIMADGKALLDGGMSGWLTTLISTETTSAAQRALTTVGVI